MRFWLLNASEPSSYLTPDQRPMRTGILAEMLLQRGHEVILWKSTFDHVSKRHLAREDTVIHPTSKLTIYLLHSRGYRRHVSVARLLDHWELGRRFREVSRQMPRPAAILCSLPILELALETTRYGKERRIPVLLDIRDWWPDIFLYPVPRPVRSLVGLAFIPYFHMAARACADATAITGITEAFVDWGITKAARARCAWDRAFPHGYPETPPLKEALQSALEFWREKYGVSQDGGRFIVAFVGSFGGSLDLSKIIEAARMLGDQTQFVLCGAGDQRARYERLAKGLKNVVFPGWVSREAIYALLRIARVGLCPLPDRPDFLATINNKTIEYLSAGLPVISTPPRGTVYSLLKDNGCGMSYDRNSAVGLTGIVRHLQREPTELKMMSARARALFTERFSAEVVYADMCSHLERLAAEHQLHLSYSQSATL